MADSTLLTGLFAAGIQAAGVIVLVYVVVALIGGRAIPAPLADAPEPPPSNASAHRR